MAIQSRINAALAVQVGGGLVAAAISFGTGLVLTVALALVLPNVRRGVARIPKALRLGNLRWWQLIGGLGGAWLVTTQGLVVTVVGVTVFMVAVVAGQVSGSLAVDRVGLSPAGVLPVSNRRAIAAGLALVAVALSGISPSGFGQSAAVVAVLLAVSAGLGVSVQQAINARVSAATGEALAAALVNFIVGMAGLCVAVGAGMATGTIVFGHLPSDPWLYLGGPIGVTFIAMAAWAVRGIGVLAFGLLAIAGQMLGAVGLDLFAPSGNSALGVGQFAGLALVGVAVWLAGSRPRA